MKTIILTSSGWLKPVVRRAILPYLPAGRGLKVGYISTASKVVKDDTYAKRDVAIMQDELGFDLTEIDLSTFSPDELPDVLSRQEVVYVQGGNGFFLLKHARRTGFIDLARQLVNDGSLVYVGKSAGSYLACPTIEMHTWHSDKWRRFGIEDLRAMHLVPFLLQTHYSEDANFAIEKGMKHCNFPLRLLTNEQAFVVRDDVVSLVGEGGEHLFPFTK